jgi:putative transposase
VSYTDRIDELGVSASIGTVGDSFDNAMAESVMGIFTDSRIAIESVDTSLDDAMRATPTTCISIKLKKGASLCHF